MNTTNFLVFGKIFTGAAIGEGLGIALVKNSLLGNRKGVLWKSGLNDQETSGWPWMAGPTFFGGLEQAGICEDRLHCRPWKDSFPNVKKVCVIFCCNSYYAQ